MPLMFDSSKHESGLRFGSFSGRRRYAYFESISKIFLFLRRQDKNVTSKELCKLWDQSITRGRYVFVPAPEITITLSSSEVMKYREWVY